MVGRNILLMMIISLVLSTIILYQSNETLFKNESSIQQSQGHTFYFPYPMFSLSQFEDHDPITIDGNDDFRNQATEEGWLGNGTASNHYIIDGFKIIGSGLVNLIKISNTDLYFRISNCLLMGGFRGTYLSNAKNSYNVNNTFINNSNSGIYLNSSGNCFIVNNTLTNNKGSGIYLFSSDNSTIANNSISNNKMYGIHLSSVAYSTIESNFIFNNSNGIHLSSLFHNTFLNNIISNNSWSGVYLLSSSYISFVNNTISNNSWSGIYMDSSGNSTLVNNTFTNNKIGISLSSSTNNTIMANVFSYNDWSSMSLHSSNNNNIISNAISFNNGLCFYLNSSNTNLISTNTIFNNQESGIHLDFSDFNTISNNVISNNNGSGIYLFSSNNSTIANNSISNNSDHGIYLNLSDNTTLNYNTISYSSSSGISLIYSGSCTLTNNNISKNSWLGVNLFYSEKNMIGKNNILNNSGNGIFVSSSDFTTIISNTIQNNSANGVFILSSNYSTIGSNIISNNDNGVHLSSSCRSTIYANLVYYNNYGLKLFLSCSNILSRNIIFSNIDYGIYFSSSGNNTISDNHLIDDSLFMSGSQLGHFLQAAVTNNLVNGNPLVYWANMNNGTVPSGAGQVILVNCTAVNVTEQNLERASAGVFVAFCRDLLIYDNVLCYNSRYGIYLFSSVNNTISYNFIFDNDIGIGLHNSANNIIENNQLTDNGFLVFGDNESHYIQEKVSENVINGKTLIYWQNVTGGTVPEGTGQVILINCINVKVIGQILTDVNIGIFAFQCTNLTIQENIISDNDEGVRFVDSINCSIIRNIIINSRYNGIFLQSSHLNAITENLISYNDLSGLVLVKSDSNIIYNNYILSNGINGIDLWTCNENYISTNKISNNNEYGIYLNLSGWNRVVWNSFIGNSRDNISQAYDQGNIYQQNFFSSNYWDDWTAPDVDADGIVDYIYLINGSSNNYDYNPTTVPIQVTFFALSEPTILFPNGRENLGGVIKIEWFASSGLLSYDVFYDVYYSYDDGTTWIMLATGLTTTYYFWNTTTLPDGSSYYIKIIAFDSEGKMSLDLSDRSFTINNSYRDVTLLKILIALNLILVGIFLFILSYSVLRKIFHLYKAERLSRELFINYLHNDFLNSVRKRKWVILAVCGALILSVMRAWLIDPVVVVADRYDWYAINMKLLLINWTHEIDRIPIKYTQFRIVYPLLIAILSTLSSIDVILIGRLVSIFSFSMSIFYLSKILERFRTLSLSPNKERILIVFIMTPTMITNFVRVETDILFLALSLYIIHQYMMFISEGLNNLQKVNLLLAVGLLIFTREVGIVLILALLLHKFLSVSRKYMVLTVILLFFLWLVSLRIDILQELLFTAMWNATGYTPAYEVVYNNNLFVLIEIFMEKLSDPHDVNKTLESLVIAFFPSVIFCTLGFIRLYKIEKRTNLKRIIRNIITLYFLTYFCFFILFKVGRGLDRFWIPVLLFPLLFLPFTVDLEELILDFQKLINETLIFVKLMYFRIFHRQKYYLMRSLSGSHISSSFFNMMRNTFHLNDGSISLFPKSTFYFVVTSQILFYVIRLILSLITAGVLPVYQ